MTGIMPAASECFSKTSLKKYCCQYVIIFIKIDSILVRSVFEIVNVPPVTRVSSAPSLKIHIISASGLI